MNLHLPTPMKKSLYKTSLSLFCLFILLLQGNSLFACNPCTSQGNGNWNSPATWGGSIPAPNATVTINHDVILNVPATVINNLTVNSGGILIVRQNFTVNGTTTINTGGTINFSIPNMTVAFNGNFINDGSFEITSSPHVFTFGGSFTNNSSFLASATNATFNFTGNNTYSNTGTLNLGASTIILNATTNSTFTNSGTLATMNFGNIVGTNGGGTENLINNGTITVTGAGAFFQDLSVVDLDNGGTTVRYNNQTFPAAAQTIFPTTYRNLVILGNQLRSASSAIVVQGNLEVQTGTLQLGANNFTVNGTTTINSGGTLDDNTAGGVNTFNGNFTNGGNFTATGISTFNFIGNNTYLNTGNLDLGINTITLNATTTTSTFTNSGTMNLVNIVGTAVGGTESLTNAANSTITVTGTGAMFPNLNLDFTAIPNTIEYAGTSTTVRQNMADTDYHHVEFSGTRGKTLYTSPIIVTGDWIQNITGGSQGVLTSTAVATFSGTNDANIGGIVNSIIIDKSSPGKMIVNADLQGGSGCTLTLTNGLADNTGGYYMFFDGFSGGNTSSYVQMPAAFSATTGLIRSNTPINTNITFPVGTATTYNPITLQTSTVGNLTVSVSNISNLPTNTSANLNVQWNVRSSTAGAIITNTVLNWQPTNAVGTITGGQLQFFNNGSWSSQGGTATSTLVTSTTPITLPTTTYRSFSVFKSLDYYSLAPITTFADWTNGNNWSYTSLGSACNCSPNTISNANIYLQSDATLATATNIGTGSTVTLVGANRRFNLNNVMPTNTFVLNTDATGLGNNQVLEAAHNGGTTGTTRVSGGNFMDFDNHIVQYNAGLVYAIPELIGGKFYKNLTISLSSNSRNLSLTANRTITGTLNVIGEFALAGGFTLTTNTTTTSVALGNSGGRNFTISGTGTKLLVRGTMENDGHNLQLAAGGVLEFADLSTAIYNNNIGGGGAIPIATWGTASLCNIEGVTTQMTPSSLAQTFGNFTWNCPTQTANQSVGGNMIVKGNFTLLATNNRQFNFGTSNLNIAGNFTNNIGSTFFDPLGSGTFTFNGTTSAQTISGATNFNNLTIINTASTPTVTLLTGGIVVRNNLVLTDGRLVLGANDLNHQGTAPAIIRTNGWIETNGTGAFIRNRNGVNFTFPVGDNTAIRSLYLGTTVIGNNSVRFIKPTSPSITGTLPSDGMWEINIPAVTSTIAFRDVGGTADATSKVHKLVSSVWTEQTTTPALPDFVATGQTSGTFTVFTPPTPTFTSTQAGDWTTPSTWGGTVPSIGSNVNILHTVTIPLSATVNVGTITIGASGMPATLSLANSSVNLTANTINVDWGSTLSLRNANPTLAFLNSNGQGVNTLSMTAGTNLATNASNFRNANVTDNTKVLFTGTVSFTIPANLGNVGTGYPDLFIQGGGIGVKSLPDADITVKNLVIEAGTLASAATAARTLTINGDLSVFFGTSFTSGFHRTINLANRLIANGTLTIDPASTLNFVAGTTNITILGATNPIQLPNSVSVAANKNVTLNSGTTVTMSGTLVLNSSATFTNNGTLSLVGQLTGTSGNVFTNTATLNYSSPNVPILTGGTFDVDAVGNTVNYNGTAQSISAFPFATNYHNLTFSGSGNKTLTGNLTTNGNLTVGAGTTFLFGISSKTVTVTGNLSGAGTINLESAAHQLFLNGANNTIGTLTTDANNSLVSYGAVFNQQVFASPNYRRLQIDVFGIKTLQGNTTATSLNFAGFSTQKLALGNFNLTLPALSSIISSDNTRYIITNGNGNLIADFSGGLATVPIGISATSYDPISFSTSALANATYNFRVGSPNTNGLQDLPNTTNRVEAVWRISASAARVFNANEITFGWNTNTTGSLAGAFLRSGTGFSSSNLGSYSTVTVTTITNNLAGITLDATDTEFGVFTPASPPTQPIGNRGMYFDGVDDYVDMGGNALDTDLNGSNFTIEAWIKLSEIRDNVIVGKWASAGGVYLGIDASGALRMVNTTGQQVRTAGSQFNINQWYHVAASWDDTNNTTELYINGNQLTIDNTVITDVSTSTTVPLRIGSRGSTAGVADLPFFGQIDEVRIFGGVTGIRTSAQIQAFEYGIYYCRWSFSILEF